MKKYLAWCVKCRKQTIRTLRHPLSKQVCPVCSTPRKGDTA